MLPLGTSLPPFSLPNVMEGTLVSSDSYRGSKCLLVAFICNHCPYVIHIQKVFVAFAAQYLPRGLQVVSICANDQLRYPQDGPSAMKLEAKKAGYSFPYLFDETQSTALAFHAACTPDFFLFDHHLKLVYRGRFDESTPGNNKPLTGSDLRLAVDSLLAGKPLSSQQYPSLGCSIKWKPGNSPSYH